MNIISPLDLEWILQSAYEKKKKKKERKKGWWWGRVRVTEREEIGPIQ